MTAAIFGDGRCGHCGMMHGPICPRVKAIEYYENGSVKRVEYHIAPPPMKEPPPIVWVNPDFPDDYIEFNREKWEVRRMAK